MGNINENHVDPFYRLKGLQMQRVIRKIASKQEIPVSGRTPGVGLFRIILSN